MVPFLLEVIDIVFCLKFTYVAAVLPIIRFGTSLEDWFLSLLINICFRLDNSPGTKEHLLFWKFLHFRLIFRLFEILWFVTKNIGIVLWVLRLAWASIHCETWCGQLDHVYKREKQLHVWLDFMFSWLLIRKYSCFSIAQVIEAIAQDFDHLKTRCLYC